MVAAYLYVAANAGESDVPWLASLIVDGAGEDLGAAGAAGMEALFAGDRAGAAFALGRIAYLAERNLEALEGLRRIGSHAALAAAAGHIRAMEKAQAARLTEQGVSAYRRAGDRKDGGLVVRRKGIGTIPLDELSQEQREGFPSGAWDKMVTVALYWCDGKRTVDEVARLTEFEMGRPLSFAFGPYFRFLERKGYLEIVR
jgi:hypothetical protein